MNEEGCGCTNYCFSFVSLTGRKKKVLMTCASTNKNKHNDDHCVRNIEKCIPVASVYKLLYSSVCPQLQSVTNRVHQRAVTGSKWHVLLICLGGFMIGKSIFIMAAVEQVWTTVAVALLVEAIECQTPTGHHGMTLCGLASCSYGSWRSSGALKECSSYLPLIPTQRARAAVPRRWNNF